MSLCPEHKEDLLKSGLTDDTIGEAGFRSVPPDQFAKVLGFKDHGIESLLEIPYLHTDDYCRYKVWYQAGAKPGPKYLTRKNSMNRLYLPSLPPGAINALVDAAVPLYITEGEKKALKAVQEGILCIGVSGLWNWKRKGEDVLIPDFDCIVLKGRKVIIVPDSDWCDYDSKGRVKNLAQAVSRLATLLTERGATVSWVDLNGA